MRAVKLGNIIRPASVIRAGGDEFEVLSMTMRDGLVRQAERFKKQIAGNDLSQYKVVERGQLVVGFPIDEAVLAFQRVIDAGIVSPAYGVWDVADDQAADRNYLERFLRSPRAIRFYKSRLQGSTARRRSLPNPVFLEMEVPLPPLDEQRRIAAILDKADALRAQRRQTIAHLDTLAHSIFHEMFGHPQTQDQFEYASLSDVVRLRSGGTPSKEEPENWIGAVRWFSPKDIKTRYLNESIDHVADSVVDSGKLRLLPARTIVMVVRGMILAHSFPVAMLNEPSTINQDLKALELKVSMDPEYLLACLRAQDSHVVAQVETSAHGTKRLSSLGIGSIRIPLPPLSLQQTFATRVAAVERLKEQHQRHLAELDTLFASLQHRAFTGQL